MNYLSKLFLWLILASFVMFVVYFWLPDLIGAIGAFIGFITVVLVDRTISYQNFKKDIFLFGIFVLITGISYFLLILTCTYAPVVTSCNERSKNSLLLSNIFFVGTPILVAYIFGWLPNHIRRWKQNKS